MNTVAFLGLGAMGSRIATRLLKAGHPVTVWNRSVKATAALREVGARVAATPRAASESAHIVIAMVRDDAASRFVWLDGEIGALHGMQPHSVALDSSTLSVEWVKELANHASNRQIAFLDAPVLGSRPQAEAGQLIYLVGGSGETLDRVRPILQTTGGAVHHVGETGMGAALKLAANALFGIQVAAIAELFGFLESQGLEKSRALAILGSTPLLSASAKGAATQMVSGAFAPLFPVELAEKDFGYATDTATRSASRVPVTEVTRAIYAEAMRQGLGTDNLTGIIRIYSHGLPQRRP
jgi:3-hydroxyisobutyrate dehydrogenase